MTKTCVDFKDLLESRIQSNIRVFVTMLGPNGKMVWPMGASTGVKGKENLAMLEMSTARYYYPHPAVMTLN